MDPFGADDVVILVNALGHLSGALVFAGFLYLLWRSRRRSPRPHLWLPATAGALALLWNAGSLTAFALPPAAREARGLTAALSFGALSLLPAVLLHLSLTRRQRWLRRAGYGLSGAALAVHLSEWTGAGWASHEIGLQTITFGFGSLAIVAAIMFRRQRGRFKGAGARAFAAMALFLFAVSVAHFGSDHEGGLWLHELVVHHAGIPLALFVLLQDYRFLLLDVFFRFLGNAAFAAAFAASLLYLFANTPFSGGFREALLIAGVASSLLAFVYLRQRVQTAIENLLFPREPLEPTVAELQRLADSASDERAFLDAAAQTLAQFVQAQRWKLTDASDAPFAIDLLQARLLEETETATTPYAWAEALTPLRVSGGPLILLLGRRELGRRYLSGDFASLNRLSAEVVDLVEKRRRDELQSLVAQAELQALRAQINPHFLFNSLNALYGVIPRAAAEARQTLVSLADIFRYSLQSQRQYVSLEEEIRITEAYLQIERLRLGSRLQTRIEIAEDVKQVRIPVLTIQPLVENAVKHGVSPKAEGGSVQVRAERKGGHLEVSVSDTGIGLSTSNKSTTGNGQGLANVRQRLALCYGAAARLDLRETATGTTASFRFPAASS